MGQRWGQITFVLGNASGEWVGDNPALVREGEARLGLRAAAPGNQLKGLGEWTVAAQASGDRLVLLVANLGSLTPLPDPDGKVKLADARGGAIPAEMAGGR